MVPFRLEMPRVVASFRFHPYATIEKAFAQMVTSDSELQRLVAAEGGASRVMENIYLAFKQGVANNNTDKAFYLTRIREYNAVAERMSAYIETLVTASGELRSAESTSPYTCRDVSNISSWQPITFGSPASPSVPATPTPTTTTTTTTTTFAR